ncbi:MAG: hypothetical protein ACRYF3_16845 [Janthinobacterium lividum]
MNCALGGAVALRVLDTSDFRWVHHAVYIATVALTAAAAVDLARRRDAALFRLLPVAVPLALIPRVSARSRRHALVAASAAPAYAATLLRLRKG